MDVFYRSDSFGKDITIKKKRCKKYKALSDMIYVRIEALKAVDNLSMIPHTPPFRRHILQGKLKGMFAIDISPKDRIVFEPIGQFEKDDLSTIVAIKIIDIGDYH